jgi:hypothetical protein
MTNPQIVDQQITAKEIQNLKSAEQVVDLFDMLGYPVADRIEMTPEALNLSDDLSESVQRIEKISSVDEMLDVYLVELLSLTVARRKALARAFRDFPMEFLFVLTDDYKQIDFMLLERKIPAHKDFGIGKRKALIHHHTFSVDRTNPDQVALRVMKRFSFTAYDQEGERDPLGQYDKLKSAFTTARWSEPYFNNRALFSDYYLTERVPEHSAWEADERHQVFRAIRSVFANAGSLSGKDHLSLQREIIIPVLEEIGFTSEVVESQEGPDLKLFPEGNMSGEQAAFALCYPWNRYLDGRDAGGADPERGDENPGAVMVGLLEEGRASWGILTNGKIWRLYSAEAHSRATNYYEIDLEEALASTSPGKAFRYFYLLFRADAFIPERQSLAGETRELSFLDLLLEESDLYARQLGDRLKDTVFEEVFPYFAEGFIEGMGGADVLLELPEEDREEKLRLVYRGTLTFLYRLLFLLYAESRDLLPVREVRGYYKKSLQRIKERIAAEAGDIEELAPENIRNAFGKTETDLYERFTKLCGIVDEGSPAINVPVYNGGLFLTDPERARSQRDKEISSFLLDYPIPDQFFALGLDKMARDIDFKKHTLGLIDYKSLGVRQLGSIYEGLLEFKVRVATEKMAVVEGKQTEEIVPYSEAKEEGLGILREGRGQNAKERVIPRGEIYLVNDKRERKATGSYYTPDYIVKYIVEHTVGPVLDEKLEELQPRMRETEQKYRALMKKKHEVEREDSDPYQLLKDNFGGVILDLFDIKVLDPAMGSGHFLVEAVDYITDRLVRFLDRYPFLSVFFEGMKETILNELSDQGVVADPELLTDVNLLKRHVLKRCIYGVDLNPMAVELAKVSLWLDCFTLGAPLSFLDHHLKCGNSLIGAMARELDEEDDRQMTFLTGPFAGLLRAAEIMRGVSLLTDVTLSQVQESGELYREYEEKAKPFKELLDIYVSQHFGVDLAEEFLTVHDQDQALQMIRGDSDTPDVYVNVVKNAQNLNDWKRFFHWDLEFPEVFIDLENTRWKHDGGFDSIIGNPPYVFTRLQEITADEKKYYGRAFTSGLGKVNSYALFIETGINLLKENGRVSLIVPNTLLRATTYKTLRELILETCAIEFINMVGTDVFEDVTAESVVFVLERNRSESYRFANEVSIFDHDDDIGKINQSEFYENVSLTFAILKGSSRGSIVEKIDKKSIRLKEILLHSISGIQTWKQHKSNFIENKPLNNQYKPMLEGKDIGRYKLAFKNKYIYYDKSVLNVMQDESIFLLPEKILVQRVSGGARPLTATIDYGKHYTFNSINTLVLEENNYSTKYVLSLLNSRLLNFYYVTNYTNLSSLTVNISNKFLREIPIYKINFGTSEKFSKKIFNVGLDKYNEHLIGENKEEIIHFVEENMLNTTGRTDIIHDYLGFMADQMIKVFKEKRKIENLFWGEINSVTSTSNFDVLRNRGKWEKTLAKRTECKRYVDPESRSTKHLDESLGWDEEAFKAFAGMLIGKSSVTPAMIDVYRKHAPEYQELSHRIKETDDLIDQIVYRLYGLTDEEIEIVERSFDE